MVRLAILSALALASSFAADMNGIWMGEAPGRNGEKQDVAFQFKVVNGVLSGVSFGEEFDLPIEDAKVDGSTVSFAVTATNYYNNIRTTTLYTGSVNGDELRLVRKRKVTEAESKPAAEQIVVLKRL